LFGNVVDHDEDVTVLKANFSTTEAMFVVLRAMTEPAPVSAIQAEFLIDLGSYGDLIEPRRIHREPLIRVFKEGLKAPIPDEQDPPMRGTPAIPLLPYPDWFL
jgi:hypothetical protein